MNPTAIRLLSQQLISPQFSKPEQVVSHFGAIQAQEYRLMRWAVAMRTKKPSFDSFKASFDSGRIVRIHLLRGTWQLISGEDYWWMMDLAASRAERVIRGWMSANKISLPEDEIFRIREILALATEILGSATKEDYVLALAEKGITMDDHRLSYHIRMSELCGLLCSGELLPMKASYSISEKKVGPKRLMEKDESLMLLARKYFQSHSPASFDDFLWWSGLGAVNCRRAIEMLGDELYQEDFRGAKFFLHRSCRTRASKNGTALLLPPYDEYLIGYKSRELSLPPEFSSKAHNNSGNFYPVIAHDGIICGNWAPFSKEPSFTFFSPDEPFMDDVLCWERYRNLCGK